jgi:hypothetical protein
MNRILLATAGVSMLLTACAPGKKTGEAPNPQPQPATAAVSFAGDIMPVFTRSCAGCHRREGGFEAAIEGGAFFEKKEDILAKVGTFIVPGKPAESGFLKVLNQSIPVGRDKIVMPPPKSRASKWTKEELDLFSRWIAEGAKDN